MPRRGIEEERIVAVGAVNGHGAAALRDQVDGVEVGDGGRPGHFHANEKRVAGLGEVVDSLQSVDDFRGGQRVETLVIDGHQYGIAL